MKKMRRRFAGTGFIGVGVLLTRILLFRRHSRPASLLSAVSFLVMFTYNGLSVTAAPYTIPDTMTTNLPSIPLHELSGKWHVNMSNLGMWTRGKNRNPSFSYTLETKKGKEGLRDEVNYRKGKKEKSIVGFDLPLNAGNTEFKWRGKGCLSGITSKWEILYYGIDFVLIHFQKTLFTPEGYDVISREKTLGNDAMRHAEKLIAELKISGMEVIPQE